LTEINNHDIFFVFGLLLILKEQTVKQTDWHSRIKLYLVEAASIASLALILAWLLWEEFKHLFR